MTVLPSSRRRARASRPSPARPPGGVGDEVGDVGAPDRQGVLGDLQRQARRHDGRRDPPPRPRRREETEVDAERDEEQHVREDLGWCAGTVAGIRGEWDELDLADAAATDVRDLELPHHDPHEHRDVQREERPQQDAPLPRAARSRRPCSTNAAVPRRHRAVRRRRGRELRRHADPTLGEADDRECAVVGLGDALDDRQAEADPAVVAADAFAAALERFGEGGDRAAD